MTVPTFVWSPSPSKFTSTLITFVDTPTSRKVRPEADVGYPFCGVTNGTGIFCYRLVSEIAGGTLKSAWLQADGVLPTLGTRSAFGL